MDDKENDSRYPPNSYGLNNQQDSCSSLRPKVSGFNAVSPRESNLYDGHEEEDLEAEELRQKGVETNGVKMIGKDTCDDEEEDEDTDDDVLEEVEEDDNGDHDGKRFNGMAEDTGIGRPRKKRKLKTLISNYEFAPRVPQPHVQIARLTQPSSDGQNVVRDWSHWTERETSALLDAWGERFLSLGRKSLRSEDWQEVAEKVSQITNVERTDAQCRNRLDTLKKKYKKENTRVTGGGSGSSKWVFYRKMDVLLSSFSQQHTGLSCGIDSGEYVFMNPNVYLDRANGADEMRDSPDNSESSRNEETDSDGLPPKGKGKGKGKRYRGKRVEDSFKLLADSIDKFSVMYEKIESDKSKQMVELENTRMEFQRQLETQRRQILERAQVEIAKIRQGNDNEKDLSAEILVDK